MQLTLAGHPIIDIQFGTHTRLDGKTLIVDSEELRPLLLGDSSLIAVDFEILHPGESCRAGPVFDIIEPRAKASGSSPDFPGILSAPQTAGMGTTHVLEGAAVTVLREASPGDSRGATGYVLEMSGAPAEGSHYASVHHLVVVPHTQPRLPGYVQQKAYRLAGLKTAVYLARTALDLSPSLRQTFEAVGPGEEDRERVPRVAYVGQIFSRQRRPEQDEREYRGHATGRASSR